MVLRADFEIIPALSFTVEDSGMLTLENRASRRGCIARSRLPL